MIVRALMLGVFICLLWAVSPILVFVSALIYLALRRERA